MITKRILKAELSAGNMRLAVSEFGDGIRGVAIFNTGDKMPVERIALQPWHVDQSDRLQFANYDEAPNWYYTVFGAGELSWQARKFLADHCRAHEAAILAWCAGDESQKLPLIGPKLWVDADNATGEAS